MPGPVFVYDLHLDGDDSIRREGAVLEPERFAAVVAAVRRLDA